MTEEIIRIIKEAEEQALLEKQAAAMQAEKIVADAQKECTQMEQATAAVCKAYKESGKKTAEEAAQKEYAETLKKHTEEAKSYCVEVLKNVESFASTVVGRIMRGDC